MSAKNAAPAAPSAPTTQQISSSLNTLVSNYTSSTPPRIKLIDAFLLFTLVSGVLQFAYRLVITSYPYNAFLGG